MNKFINIDDNTIINISEIQAIERELFDLSKQDFVVTDSNTGEKIVLEYDSLLLATFTFKNGDTKDILTGIYFDEEDTSEECDLVNQIDSSWMQLIKHLSCELVEL